MLSTLQRAVKSRMVLFLAVSLLLFAASLLVPPGHVAAVTLYKLHLMSLGGWGGYWLDRLLFPYDRPHSYLEAELIDDPVEPEPENHDFVTMEVLPPAFSHAMLRRAIVVAACLICVGLGA